MTLSKLHLIMPPPTEPVFPGTENDWIVFQNRIGLTFPVEYFAVVNTYGSGHFLDGEVKIANPFDPDYDRWVELELRTLRDRQSNFPFPIFPESGGLYPFGLDGNGNSFVWKTDGPANTWPIVCLNGEDHWEAVKYTLSDFLVRMASNSVEVDRRKFWGLFSGEVRFEPRKLPNRKGKSKKWYFRNIQEVH